MSEITKKEMYKAINEFSKEKYDRINIIVPKGERERYQQMARARGMSMSELVRYALGHIQDGHDQVNE